MPKIKLLKYFIILPPRGFSLLEILITITIIGILSAVGVGFVSSIQRNTRDAQRESDLRVLQSALQQYYADQNKYPDSLSSELDSGSALTDCSGNGNCPPQKTYLSKTPKDPAGSPYFYKSALNISSTSDCTDGNNKCHFYSLCAKMETPPAGSSCNGETNFNFKVTPL